MTRPANHLIADPYGLSYGDLFHMSAFYAMGWKSIVREIITRHAEEQ